MRHLAGSGDIPTILVVQGMTNIAFHHAMRIGTGYIFQTIRTAMFLDQGKLYTQLLPSAPFRGNGWRHFCRLDHPRMSSIGADTWCGTWYPET